MWFCLGVGAVILFAIATTPTHAQAQTVIKEQTVGTTTFTGAQYKVISLGNNYSGAITDIYTYVASSTNSEIAIRIYKCDSFEGNEPTTSTLNGSACTYEQADWDSDLLDTIPNPYGTGYQNHWTGIDLTTDLTSNSLVLLPNKYYYLAIYGWNEAGVKGANWNVDPGAGPTDKDYAYRILGATFLGPSYIYNKLPVGIYASSTVPVSFYYALAPSDNVASMELRLSQVGYTTVTLPISYSGNTGSSTNTFNMPTGNWTASIWFTNTNGYEWTCTTCSWTFTVVGSIYDDILIAGTTTIQEWVNSGVVSTSSLGTQYQCGNFLEGNFDLGSCFGSMLTNIFGLTSNALADPARDAYNQIINLPIFTSIQQTGTLFRNWSSSTVATSSSDSLTLGYSQLNASNSVTILWDDVSEIPIVRQVRSAMGWLLYLTIGLSIVTFMFFVLIGRKDI